MGPEVQDGFYQCLENPRENAHEEIAMGDFMHAALFCTCKFHLELGEVAEAMEVLEEYKSKLDNYPYLDYLRSQVLIERFTAEDNDAAVEAAREAQRQYDNIPELEYNLSKILVTALERNYVYSGGGYLPDSEDEMLDLAESMIENALDERPEHPKYLHVKGKIMSERAQFQDARRIIRQAIPEINHKLAGSQVRLSEYKQSLSSVDFQEQVSKVESEINKLGDRAKELNNEIGELRGQTRDLENTIDDLETETQNIQTRMLQFLGFFAGLIGVVVTTAQVTLSVDSVVEGTSLILVLVGGLVVAFSGFSFILPRPGDDDVDRAVFAFVIGALLVISGIVYHIVLTMD
jgi:division protein CdvB (Snf7/Vps24/ESCRT-III family)